MSVLSLWAGEARAQCKSAADCSPGQACDQGKCVAAEPPPVLPQPVAYDTVFLKDGGRLRGQVIEEHPKQGLRIRLLDGAIREVPRDEIDRVEYAGTLPAPPVAPAAPGPAVLGPAAPPGPPEPVAPGPSAPPSSVAPKPASPGPILPAPARPKPEPPSGSLRVSADEPGQALVDGKRVGALADAPLIVRGLSPGAHTLTVQFDAGDESEQSILVEERQTTEAHVEPPGARFAYAERAGLHWGFGGGAFYLFRPRAYAGDLLPIESALGASEHGGGGYLEAVGSYAVSPAVDLRIVPRLALGYDPVEWTYSDKVDPTLNGNPQENTLSFVPSVLVALRLNLTADYSMMIGFRAGAEILAAGARDESGDAPTATSSTASYNGTQTPNAIVLAHWGPELSLLTFRFGAAREFEVECWQGLLIAKMPSLQMGLGLRYLLLP